MTIDNSIGLDNRQEADEKEGFPDERRAREAREKGEKVSREDTERANDRNTSADNGNRSGKTNKIADDSIEVENVNVGAPATRE